MKIAILTSEAIPFGRKGGLGEVAASLSRQLAVLGHDVTLMMPYFSDIRVRPTGIMSPLRFGFGGRQLTYSIIESYHQGVHFVLIDAPQYFHRTGIYGDDRGDYGDNDERFIFFTRACLDYFVRKDVKPDVFHAHDWPTALTALYLKTHYSGEPVGTTPVVFTIHNVEYQGVFRKDRFHLLDLGWEYFTSEGLEFYDSLNYLKAGVLYSDVLSTVSRRYAEEIQAAESGHGMEGVFRARSEQLFGILNGIDTDLWNPGTDPHLSANYGPENPEKKKECRAALLEETGLKADPDVPVVAMVSRLTAQKSLDLIEVSAERLMKMDLVLVALGTGEEHYEKMLQELARRHPGRCFVSCRYDSELAHRVIAGADMFLRVSRTEPCGHGHLYSLRYGAVPIVHATGGLDDAVQEWDRATGTGNGFKFSPCTAEAMLDAIKRSLDAFQDRESWGTLVKNGMSGDYSWDRAAQQYLGLYERAMRLKS